MVVPKSVGIVSYSDSILLNPFFLPGVESAAMPMPASIAPMPKGIKAVAPKSAAVASPKPVGTASCETTSDASICESLSWFRGS